MIDGSRVALVRVLRERYSYAQPTADEIATALRALTPEFREDATRYLWFGDVRSHDVGAYNAQRLIEEFDMVPLAAFLTLGWLIRDPAQIKEAMAAYRSFTIISSPFVNPIRLRSMAFDLAALTSTFERLRISRDDVFEPILQAAQSIFGALESRLTLAIDANDLGEILGVITALQKTIVPLSIYGLEDRFSEWRSVGENIFNRALSEATIQKRSIESGINTVAGFLVSKFGVEQHASMDQARKLMSIAPALQNDLRQYWENGEVPCTTVDRTCVLTIMETDGLDLVTAFLRLDRIVRQNEMLSDGSLRRLRSLRSSPKPWPRSPQVSANAKR